MEGARLTERQKSLLGQYAISFWGGLEALAGRLIGPQLRLRLDAESAVQETYVLMAEEAAMGRYPLPEKPPAARRRLGVLLRRIVMRAAERESAVKRDMSKQVQIDVDLPARHSAYPEDVAAVADLVVAVDKALGRRSTVIMVRRFFASASVREIAEELGVSVATVKRHLRRLRRYRKLASVATGV